MKTRTIMVAGEEFRTASEAIQHANATGLDLAVLIGGKALVVSREEAERLEMVRVPFAYLYHHQESGRLVTVPVN